MSARFRSGVYAGTGASLDIEVGFIPEFVILTNVTDGDIVTLWFDGMAAASSIDIGAAAAGNTAGSTDRFAGTAAAKGQGFSTGIDNSESAKVYRWAAFAGA